MQGVHIDLIKNSLRKWALLWLRKPYYPMAFISWSGTAGLRPLSRHTRDTNLWLVPNFAASVRVLQCVAPSGFLRVVISIIC